MAHVEFLLSLEHEFDFRMTPRAVMTIKSLKDALQVVQSELGR